jgi:hypothetical protein
MENPGLKQQLKLVSSSANYWIIFCLPLIMGACIGLLDLNNLYPFSKETLELAALIILAGFGLLCFSRFVYSKDKFFLWASAMMLVLFVREVHPPGSSEGVYLGLLALFYIAHKNHQIFVDYFRNKYLVNLLGVGFFTYFISVTTDQRWWRFIPGEKMVYTTVEESMEVLGHIIIGCAFLFAAKQAPENS